MTMRKHKCPFIDARLSNMKEDAHLQQTLDHINHRFKVVSRSWSRERDLLVGEHRKLLHLQACEPYASVDKTMTEISVMRNARLCFMDLTVARSGSRGMLTSCKSLWREGARSQMSPQLSKLARACTKSPSTTYLQRPRSMVTFSQSTASSRHHETGTQLLSIMQLREMATIDNISRKELESQEGHARLEKDRQKLLLRNELSQRIQSFLKKFDPQIGSQPKELEGASQTNIGLPSREDSPEKP